MLFELVHGDLPRQNPFGNTLRFTGGPVPADSRQGNAIGTQLRGDPINTAFVAEIGRNSVLLLSKHQIQPEYGDEQADAGQDCRTRLERPNSPARTGTGKYSFSLFS